MDSNSVAMSWGLFGAAVAVGCYYYWPKNQNRPDRSREDAQHAGRRKRNEQEGRGRQIRRPSPERSGDTTKAESTATDRIPSSGNEVTRKRKAQTKDIPPTPAVVVQAEEPEEIDMSTKQWAEQMLQARKGYDLTSAKNKEQRVRTVKQSSALNTPVLSSGSSHAGGEGDDDASPIPSPSYDAGDVSDMLEPKAAGPSTLRVTAPLKPQKERVAKKPKEEDIETKKQRQNRQKVEERRLQREAEEKERKALEEKQRRTAREARGEPAKNGMQASKPPASNAWSERTSAPVNGSAATPEANGTRNAPLLDTFDAESNSSSNGYPEPSTSATSTTSAGAAQWDHDIPSEEDQIAQAMRQSEDESGWTTVAQPKKQKKKSAPEASGTEQVLTNKTNVMPAKPATNGKPVGFQALDVEYEQRTDADPNDASNWDA